MYRQQATHPLPFVGDFVEKRALLPWQRCFFALSNPFMAVHADQRTNRPRSDSLECGQRPLDSPFSRVTGPQVGSFFMQHTAKKAPIK